MINFLTLVINLYMLAVIIRAFYSWVRPDPSSKLAVFIYNATDPVLVPLRKAIPPIGGRFDVSPIIVLIFAAILKGFLLNL